MPIYGVLARHALDLPFGRGALAGVVVNLVSHPLGFLLIGPALRTPLGDTGALALVEAWAWLSEATLLWLAVRRRWAPEVALVSLVANGASLGVGVALSVLVG